MWTTRSSDSLSPSKLQSIPFTSDSRLGSPTALCCELPEPNVAKVDTADWAACVSGLSAVPSWYQVHNDEMDLFDDTVDLTSYQGNVDDLPADAASCRSLFDAVDSYSGPVGPSTRFQQQQQQLSVSFSNGNLWTLSPEHQQREQQRYDRQTCLAECEDEMVTLAGEQSTEAATHKCGPAALTMEEERMLSGGAPFSMTYKGRRLRHIAPKPTSPETVAEPATQTTQHHQTAPKITFSVVFSGPPSSTATAAVMTSSNRTSAVNRGNSDEQSPSSGVSQARSSGADKNGGKLSSGRVQWQWRCFECSESFADYNVYKVHARQHSFRSATCHLCHQPLYTIENPDIHICRVSPSATDRGSNASDCSCERCGASVTLSGRRAKILYRCDNCSLEHHVPQDKIERLPPQKRRKPTGSFHGSTTVARKRQRTPVRGAKSARTKAPAIDTFTEHNITVNMSNKSSSTTSETPTTISPRHVIDRADSAEVGWWTDN